jgi:FlaA1/EpsC-like NDP-sugar epimerase
MGEVRSWKLGPLRVSSSRPETNLWRLFLKAFASFSSRLPSGLFIRANQIAIDAALTALSVYLAYQVRFDGAVPASHAVVMKEWMIALPLLRVSTMLVLKGYDVIWRYFNLQDSVALALKALPATLVILGMRLVRIAAAPIGAIAVELLLFLCFAGGIRVLRRASFELVMSASTVRRRAIVVGSDDTLAGAIRQVGLSPDMEIVALLCPDNKLHGLRIAGFTVVDDFSALPGMLATQSVDLVLIADPKLSSLGELVATCLEFGVEARLLPTAGHVVRGDVRISAPLEPDVVLGHRGSPVDEPHPLVVEAFNQRVVLVTGAGGSIGSELARQVLALPVSSLVLFDHDENSIFEIHGELAASNSRATIVPVVGSVRDRSRLNGVFRSYRPHIVLHAAAYKHVPMMEFNPCEAVLNNVLGTREVLDLARQWETERFLMISTDKAVEPTSVMGASKKIAEMLVQDRATHGGNHSSTRCACVRFGNVVGSRGSVIPIFIRQIAAGGPITITHEEMTRYLVTIPDAVQLVLQAAASGSNGRIYMLDMGDPVKITELARKLIQASGLIPDRDIEIRFIGSRPGEKLHEKLWAPDARIGQTQFKRVLEMVPAPMFPDFSSKVEQLESAALDGNEDLVLEYLRSLPIGFQGENEDREAATA